MVGPASPVAGPRTGALSEGRDLPFGRARARQLSVKGRSGDDARIYFLGSLVSYSVKGILFLDYVRMIRGHKGVDWSSHLTAEDLGFVSSRIDANAWYPMASFERMGNAILKEIAGGNVDAARLWGRFQVDSVRALTPTLVAFGDPVETLMRFRVLRSTFFDFDALSISSLIDGHATVNVRYHMGLIAEEAASYQTMGFFERLVEVAGGSNVHARFTRSLWCGDQETVFEIDWITGAMSS
jgi:hypothetical protein